MRDRADDVVEHLKAVAKSANIQIVPSSGDYCTQKMRKNKKRYCLHCKKLRKKKYILWGELICKNPVCPLRPGYVHPSAPQERPESMKVMEINSGVVAPTRFIPHSHVSLGREACEAYDKVKTDNMQELMKDGKWVDKYKIKEME